MQLGVSAAVVVLLVTLAVSDAGTAVGVFVAVALASCFAAYIAAWLMARHDLAVIEREAARLGARSDPASDVENDLS